jgi:S-DNA-T family DNA segregation ATPase FtsK/SpoIIIE
MQSLWFLPSVIFGAVHGFTSGDWQMLAFALLSLGVWPLSRWHKRMRGFALAGPVRFDGRDVWIGEHRLPRREILWRRDWHQYLWDGLAQEGAADSWAKVLQAARARGFRGSSDNSNWIGVESAQDIDFDLSTSGPHMLIIGATGSGKSEFMRLLVSGWLTQASPVDLTLIDYKGGATMARFAKNPRVVGLATDLALTEAVSIASTLERQLLNRQILLADAKAQSIEEVRSKGLNLNRHFVVIDELGELLRQHPRLGQSLEQIASRGRSLGMHLIVSNQSMSGITRNLLVNLRARVAIGDMDPLDLNQLGFHGRRIARVFPPGWRDARLKTGTGFELDFAFPLGF